MWAIIDEPNVQAFVSVTSDTTHSVYFSLRDRLWPRDYVLYMRSFSIPCVNYTMCFKDCAMRMSTLLHWKCTAFGPWDYTLYCTCTLHLLIYVHSKQMYMIPFNYLAALQESYACSRDHNHQVHHRDTMHWVPWWCRDTHWLVERSWEGIGWGAASWWHPEC